MDNNPNSTDDISEYKHQINLDIEASINSIIKHTNIIFESIKFNETQELEETNNLQILSSTQMIGNKMNNLLKTINLMKADFLKKSEFNYESKKEIDKANSESLNNIYKRIDLLQDLHNNMSISLKDFKSRKNYMYCMSYN